MYVLVINPFVIGVRVPFPFDKILLLASFAELPGVQNLLDFVLFFVINQIWGWL